MAAKFNRFLKDHRALTTFHTHVSLGQPPGKYTISQDLGEFWVAYRNCVQDTDAASGCPAVAESPGDETPVLVDIDLSETIPATDERDDATIVASTRLYSPRDARQVIAAFQGALRECVADYDDEHLLCVLLEKPPYVETTGSGIRLVKNGFHLHFPKMFLDRVIQKVYLFPLAARALGESPLASRIDENSISVHWLLYGSAKPGKTPYRVSGCYDHATKAVDFATAFRDHRICFPKSCRDFDDRLPQIFSLFLGDRREYYHTAKPSVATPLLDKFASVRTLRKPFVQMSVEDSIREAEELVALIDPARADDRTDWLTVGFCLHNISGGDDDGLTCWLGFSEQSEKYKEAECITIWEGMRENRYTVGTLKHFAKLDSPAAYLKWVQAKSQGYIAKIIKTSHTDVARLLFTEYGSEFVCASIADRAWYQFVDHTWKLVDRGTTLRQRISSENGALMQLLLDRLDEALRETDKDGINAIEKVIRNLKSAPTKNNIMTECAEIFYNKDFLTLLNSDPNLFAFKNGIYDFTQNVFRPGKPEDYISKQAPIDYLDFKTFGHPQVIKVDEFFRQIFPNPKIREYFLWQTSKVFIGGNSDKICLFWTGAGNNGKTVTQSLFEKLLGPYAVKLNTSVITGKKIQNGAPNPEMARLGDGCRWAVLEEPNSDETINTGIFKNLTGNDTFFARDLYCAGKATREIKPFFKLHFICNKLPNLSNSDVATWNRIRVIPFQTTFTAATKCPPTQAEREEKRLFPVDIHFEEKLPGMLPALAWYLLAIWSRNRHFDEPEPPEEVMQATANYKDESNIYKQFVESSIADCPGSNLSVNQVVAMFKEWKKIEYPSVVVAPRHIKLELAVFLGEPHQDRIWRDKQLKSHQEEAPRFLSAGGQD